MRTRRFSRARRRTRRDDQHLKTNNDDAVASMTEGASAVNDDDAVASMTEGASAVTDDDAVASCTMCGREVLRQLACVDAADGSLLCPIHYRARHFQRVFSQRKRERWSTPATKRHESRIDDRWTTPRAQQLQAPNTAATPCAPELSASPLSPVLTASIEASIVAANAARKPLTKLEKDWVAASERRSSGLRTPRHRDAASDDRLALPSDDGGAPPWTKWLAQIAASERADRLAQRLMERAERWHESERLRQPLRVLRAHRGSATLIRSAHRHRQPLHR